IVVAEVTDKSEEQAFSSRAHVETHWVHRGATPQGTIGPLEKAVAALTFPKGDGYCWVAAEAGVAKSLRVHLVGRGQPKEWVKAAAYWRHGVQAVHETFND